MTPCYTGPRKSPRTDKIACQPRGREGGWGSVRHYENSIARSIDGAVPARICDQALARGVAWLELSRAQFRARQHRGRIVTRTEQGRRMSAMLDTMWQKLEPAFAHMSGGSQMSVHGEVFVLLRHLVAQEQYSDATWNLAYGILDREFPIRAGAGQDPWGLRSALHAVRFAFHNDALQFGSMETRAIARIDADCKRYVDPSQP